MRFIGKNGVFFSPSPRLDAAETFLCELVCLRVWCLPGLNLKTKNDGAVAAYIPKDTHICICALSSFSRQFVTTHNHYIQWIIINRFINLFHPLFARRAKEFCARRKLKLTVLLFAYRMSIKFQVVISKFDQDKYLHFIC